MKRNVKILYIMAVDWKWIYQRPHIIAEYLEKRYDVTVAFSRSILDCFTQNKGKYPMKYRILWRIPWQERSRLVERIAEKYAKRFYRDIHQYDIIMLEYPLHYKYIPKDYEGKIIYDCMDNYEELIADKRYVPVIREQEKKLIQRANTILVTARKLQQKIQGIAETGKEIVLVRNGTDISNPITPKKELIKNRFRLGYFGTIAEWFDFDLLVNSLDKFQDIEYHLIGPLNIKPENNRDRIIMEGVVEHDKLYEFTKDYDCLIMPFMVTEVVEGVDPVKLYEYIAMGQCIISVWYEEIERFQDYVYMYKNPKEYVQLLEELKEKGFPPKYTAEQQEIFLQENSWDNRFERIDKVIHDTLGE